MIIGNPMMLPQLPIEDALERMKLLGYEGAAGASDVLRMTAAPAGTKAPS
jgi:hypothetical protein